VLLLTLVDRVSSGGNLLIGVGPDRNGKIPTIMEDRLRGMGRWLRINGEAIYNSTKFTKPYQASKNGTIQDPDSYKRKHGLFYLPGDFILAQTLLPEAGYGVKELYFTQGKGCFYIHVIKWASKVTIADLDLTGKKVTMLETKQQLTVTKSGGNSIIQMPDYDLNSITSEYIWVLKVQ
jgi:alpha-L-fucosidase